MSAAISSQYDAALRSVGVEPEGLQPIVGDAVVRATVSSLYEAKPSGQAVMQGLASLREESKNAGLVGAHVVEIIATMQHGVAARALRTIGIDMETLRAAARTAAATYRP